MTVWTGLREGELLGLTWSSIDFENEWIHVQQSLKRLKKGKGGRGLGDPKTEDSVRHLPLTPEMVSELHAHKQQQAELRLKAGHRWVEQDFIFTTRHGSPIDPSNLRKRKWYPLLDKHGVRRLHIHDLRHTFGTILVNDLGADLKTVQTLMGHTDIRMTEKYLFSRTGTKKKAVIKLDGLLTAKRKGNHHTNAAHRRCPRGDWTRDRRPFDCFHW